MIHWAGTTTVHLISNENKMLLARHVKGLMTLSSTHGINKVIFFKTTIDLEWLQSNFSPNNSNEEELIIWKTSKNKKGWILNRRKILYEMTYISKISAACNIICTRVLVANAQKYKSSHRQETKVDL